MKIVAFAGGVGGAKLADGLAQVLPSSDLTIVVNTGDDFEHLGLSISPDLDTVCYTLAGMANPDTGWGLSGDTFHALEALGLLGHETWFKLGDKDLATHILRTARLREGFSLSQVTKDLCRSWGIQQQILPMTDQPVRTRVMTSELGTLDFQEYFVRHRCEPTVRGFEFPGCEDAVPSPGVLESIRRADAVVLCPSNPWVSIDPILAVPGIRPALKAKRVIAISPLIDGRTIKGPAAKMFAELGIRPRARAVAEHYGTLLTAFVLDEIDRAETEPLENIPFFWLDIIMKNRQERRRLAQDVLNLIQSL